MHPFAATKRFLLYLRDMMSRRKAWVREGTHDHLRKLPCCCPTTVYNDKQPHVQLDPSDEESSPPRTALAAAPPNNVPRPSATAPSMVLPIEVFSTAFAASSAPSTTTLPRLRFDDLEFSSVKGNGEIQSSCILTSCPSRLPVTS